MCLEGLKYLFKTPIADWCWHTGEIKQHRSKTYSIKTLLVFKRIYFLAWHIKDIFIQQTFFQNLNTVNCLHLSSWEINWTLMILPLIKQVCVWVHACVGDFVVHGAWWCVSLLVCQPSHSSLSTSQNNPHPRAAAETNFQTDRQSPQNREGKRERGITGERDGRDIWITLHRRILASLISSVTRA